MRKMHAFGANLRKLQLQAKICTPPGGAMVAKICKLCTVTNVLGSQTHLLRHKRKLTPHTNFFLLPPRGGDVSQAKESRFTALP